ISGRTGRDCKTLSPRLQWETYNARHRCWWYKRNVFRFESGLAHIGLVLPADVFQRIKPRDGFKPEFILRPAARFDQISSHTSKAIARTLGFASILIENANPENVAGSVPQDQTICADSKVPIAYSESEIRIIPGNVLSILNEQKIVSESVRLDEWN